MKTIGLSGVIRSLTVAVLAVSVSVELPLAGDHDAPQRLSDSLSIAYESSEGGVGFDASTARLDDYLTYAASQSPALKAAFYE